MHVRPSHVLSLHSVIGFGLLSAAMAMGVVAANGRLDESPASSESRNERAIEESELDHELINRHLAHRPGECRQCDTYRDWEARPVIEAR